MNAFIRESHGAYSELAPCVAKNLIHNGKQIPGFNDPNLFLLNSLIVIRLGYLGNLNLSG
jgi:hypothetical protein